MGCCSSCCCESTDSDQERRPLLGSHETRSTAPTSTVVSSQPRRPTEDVIDGTDGTHKIDFVSETTYSNAAQLRSAAAPHDIHDSGELTESRRAGKPKTRSEQPAGEPEISAAPSTEISDRNESGVELLVDIEDNREITQAGPSFQRDEPSLRPVHIPTDARFEENSAMPANKERMIEDGKIMVPVDANEPVAVENKPKKADSGQPAGELEVSRTTSTEIGERNESHAEVLLDIQEIPGNSQREIIQTLPSSQRVETTGYQNHADIFPVPTDGSFDENGAMPATKERMIEDGKIMVPVDTNEPVAVESKPKADNEQHTGELEVSRTTSTEIGEINESHTEVLLDMQVIPGNSQREIIQTGPSSQSVETTGYQNHADTVPVPNDGRFASEDAMPISDEETTVTKESVAVLSSEADKRKVNELNDGPSSTEVKGDKQQVHEAVNKPGDNSEVEQVQVEQLVDVPKTEDGETHCPQHLALGLTWSVDRTEIFGENDIITVEQEERIKHELQVRPRLKSLHDELEAVQNEVQENVDATEQSAAADHEDEQLREDDEDAEDNKAEDDIPEQKRTDQQTAASEVSQIDTKETSNEPSSTTAVDDESSEQQIDIPGNETGDEDSVSGEDDYETSDTEHGEQTEKNDESHTTSRLSTVEFSGLTTLFRVKEGGPISGVTSLDNNLYVLRRKANYSIEVYDTVNYDFKHRLTVRDLTQCSDMTSCSQKHCLYIAANVDMIYVLTPGNSESTSWSAKDDLAGIAVIAVSHNLLATCFKIGKLREFSPDGKLLKEISLNPAIEHPLHAVQLSTGQFVVCHGSQSHRMNRVIVVNEDGSLDKKFGGRRRSSVMSPSPITPADQSALSVPCHVAVTNDNTILVADSNNCRLLVLNGGLDKLSEHNCMTNIEPVRLSLDSEAQRLYIAVNYCSTDDNKFTAGQVAVVQF